MRFGTLALGACLSAAFVAGWALHPPASPPAAAQEADRDAIRQELSRLADTSDLFAKVAQVASPSVVHVAVSRTVMARDPFDDFFNDDVFRRFFRERMPQRRYRQQGLGSGFVLDAQGHILTNSHVVNGADEVVVRLADRREFKARLVGADPQTDVAVLKVDAPGLNPVVVGDSDALKVGQWVIAIGNPFGLEQTLTVGVVSAKGRANVGILDYEDFIQTDAAINPGNSGGPLFNARGQVVGITTAILSRSGGYQGVGFAIPIKMALAIQEQIVAHGRVKRGYLGLQMGDVDEETAKELGLPKAQGSAIGRVVPGSPAAKAGIRAGDVVLKFGPAEVRDANHLKSLIAQASVGSEVKVKILRRGEERELTVKVGEQEY
jgi:serine protease Do